MSIEVIPTGRACGAEIKGANLAALTDDDVDEIRTAWLNHEVVYFNDQPLSIDQLERFTCQFGEFGSEPYVETMADHPHVIEVRREPDEKASPFGAGWHSDWSFQAAPPAATILHGKIIPPIGGETWYASGRAAYRALPAELSERIRGVSAEHSARGPYSHEGYKATRGDERAMKILPNDNAYDSQMHPVLRKHPENGEPILWLNSVYSIALHGVAQGDPDELLQTLLDWCVRDEFVYRHRWRENMLTMWDNRSVAHLARGGYDGHRRVMHRTTLAGDQPQAYAPEAR